MDQPSRWVVLTMHHEITPADLPPPPANYAHAILTTSAQAILHTSAIVPVTADGSVPSGVREQARAVWATIGVLLSGAGMAVVDVVSVTTYVVVSEVAGLPEVMGERDAALGGRRVASPRVTVPARAGPEWLVEISVVAIRAGG